jgi:hypothetical protein
MRKDQVVLPKWAAMTVWGTNVLREQAMEILVRTNARHARSNDRKWQTFVWKTLGVRTEGEAEPSFDAVEAACARLRVLPLSYLANEQIMSSWVGGAHGWCYWTGAIHAATYNIGKYPGTTEVRDEWALIAEAFPFLDLQCQLWSGEASEMGTVPLVEYVVKKGKVRMVKPKRPLLVPVSFNRPFPPDERGCNEETLREAVEVTLNAAPRPTTWEILLQ